MLKSQRIFLFGFASLLAVTACTPGKNVEDVGGQFWQRVSVSESVYQQGPKAQQMLNRDISRCVVELRELERLGTLENAIPTDIQGRTLDPDQKALYDVDTPDREADMLTELKDYNDFESCMQERGWERVEHVPFDVARKGRINYLRAHVNYDYKPGLDAANLPNSNEVGDYGDLNE